MNASSPPHASAVRFALREMRGGLRGFYVFLACIVLGVATIAGVGSVARLMGDTIEREGKTILGGDISFTLVGRDASAEERRFLASSGQLSEVATLRGMARTVDGGDGTLVEIKSVDGAYPLFGALKTKGGEGRGLGDDNPRSALVDEALLIRLGLGIGDRFRLGVAELRILGTVESEPDRLSAGADLGPRVMVSPSTLAATGLVQPGSIVYWLYRLRLGEDASEAAVAAVKADAERLFPDAGWRIRTRDDSAPGLKRNIERLATFLALIGLSALLIGGVGIANAVHAYLDGKRGVIATFKSLGAPGLFVARVYLLQIAALAIFGVLVGLAVGAAIPFVAGLAFAALIPVPIEPSVYPLELVLAAANGLLAALAFSLWPLGRVGRVPPQALFRDDVSPTRQFPQRGYAALAGTAALALVAIAVVFARDRQIALIFAGAAVAAFVLLRLVALAIVAIAKRMPRPRSTPLRLALANIHRPGSATASVVASLGLGLTLLATLVAVNGSLRRELTATIPAQAPLFYFLDVQASEVDDFRAYLRRLVPEATFDDVALLRGRIASIAGTPADQVKATPDTKWVLAGDRGLTYSSDVPRNSRVVAGSWWPADYAGPPLVSVDREIAEGIGLKLGDSIAVNVLGRIVTATVANLRDVDWQSVGLNFVLVFTPNTLRTAPHSHLVTLSIAGGATTEREVALLKEVGTSYPAVTALRVKDALDRVDDLLREISLAVLAATSITLLTAVLVLAGALAASHRRRLYDAAILKAVGATGRQVIAAFALEHLLLGLVTALFAIAAGNAAAAYVLTGAMRTPFHFLGAAAAVTLAVALLLTVGLGMVGTWRVMKAKVAPVLRGL
ncbi:MAG: FtsX-like permease family protein [Bauldia sp.]